MMNTTARPTSVSSATGKRVEYRVRPVTRYIVTSWEADADAEGALGRHGASSMTGEYSSYATAYAVAYALCKAKHEELGYPPYDERIQYPLEDFEEIGKATATHQAGDIFP